MNYHGLIRPHPPSLLTPCLLLCVTFAPLGADYPPQNSHYPLFGEAVTECKYRTAHSKHSWLMDLTLPYLLRDSVENKYRDLFHNNTFIPYILRAPFTFPLPQSNEETKTTTTDGPSVGREHVEFVLGKKIQQVLNKVQNKVKDNVITKRYTLAEPYVSTKDDGQPISMSDFYFDRNKEENFGTKEQKGAMYSPKIQPKIWKGIVNARGLWENKTLVNGISDSFDPDYEVQDSANPFPNGDFTDGGAYDSEIPALKNRSMCPNILFITLGPGEHPVNNPVYMDSDYNFHDIKNFNGTWTFPGEPRTASPESKLEPEDALARAKYMNEVFNKTREHEKIMDEYPKDRWRNKDYLLRRKKRNALNATKHEDNKDDIKEQNDIKLDEEDKNKDEINVNERDTKAKQARKQDEQKIRDLIDEEIMAKALHEKRQKNAGKLKEDQLKDNRVTLETQDKSGNIAGRHNPNNDKKDKQKHMDVNHERNNAKISMENSVDYENIKKISTLHYTTEFNYDDIESYKELTPEFKNIARDNYEDMLKTEEIRRYMKHGNEKHEEIKDEDIHAKTNYENLLKSEEIRRYGNLDKEKHEETSNGPSENEDSAISIHGNIDPSKEEETVKKHQNPKFDFLSFVEPINEQQEDLNVIEHNETLSSNPPNDKEELKPLEENKYEGTTENNAPNKFTNRQTTERVQLDETKATENKDVTSNKEQNNIEKEHETTVIEKKDVTIKKEPITIEKEHETTGNKKQDVENNKEENKTEKEHNNKAEEQNIMTKEEKNKERKQNDMTNKPTTTTYAFYESPELDSYRVPSKDYEKTEEMEGQTYETYHHESQYTEPPPQKDRLDPEDVQKVYKEPKKPRLDENKVYEMIRMTQLRKEYKESNKRDRTTPKKDHLYAKKDKVENKDENEGKTDVETSKAKVNKFKYMITEMRKKFNYIKEEKAKKVEDEATKQQKETKERIELMKEYYKTRYQTLYGETRKKVKDYPAIENTEEMAGFPVDWFRKNKDKVRTRKEIEREDIEEDLDREERDKMRYSRKKRDIRNENSMPKSRKKRATKVMLKKDNKTYVVSYKHLNLLRRKNVKIYLNHEHLRRFDNRRKKRHVVSKIDEGFDSENEFNGKYIQERPVNKNENKLDSLEDHEGDINANDPENEPIYLDSQDLEIRNANDNTEPHGIELRAEDIVDTNYIDPRERGDIHSNTKDLDDCNEQISKHEYSNIKNKDPSIDIKQIDSWVNLETNEIENWLNTNQTNGKDNIETFNTPDIDSVDMHQSELVAENDDEIGPRVKREADFVYVTRPKRGWKKHIKDKIREIKSKLSTKFRDRIYEWTTKHKWETLPDEKDRTTPTLMKKRFLNIRKIEQML